MLRDAPGERADPRPLPVLRGVSEQSHQLKRKEAPNGSPSIAKAK